MAKEALKNTVRKARFTNKGTLVVEVSSENGRESSITRPREGLKDSCVVEGAEKLLPKLTVYEIPSDMSNCS